MTRVHARAASAQAVATRSKVTKPKVRKHKIIMESITQEKKKLRSVISFEAKAPPGYTFIPAGNPVFTNACKEMCRKEGHKVYTVSTTPHQRMHDLSQQVHRIGYHFPSVVVATVCMERGFYLSTTGKVMSYEQGSSRRRADSEMSQNAINAEARDAIKDLFPNIPNKDLNQIIKTAFQKGKRKVGTAVELPLARRVQLAVVAHIRHLYTDYDRLLRVTSFQEARAAVEEPTLTKLVEWRGDDENGKVELEDVFREVIVISDDEDDDSESDSTDASLAERDSSVEIVSTRTLVGELQTKPVNFGKEGPVDPNQAQDQSDDEAPPGFRFVPETPRKRKIHKHKIDRRGFSRYQAWDRAIDRFREAAPMHTSAQLTNSAESTYPPSLLVRRPIDRDDYFRTSEIREALPSQRLVDQATSMLPREGVQEPYTRRRDPPDIIRMADGTVFERAGGPRKSEYDFAPPELMEPSSVVRSRSRLDISSEQVRYPVPRDPMPHSVRPGVSAGEPMHRVLPSIEDPGSTDISAQERSGFNLLARKRDTYEDPKQELPHRPSAMDSSLGNGSFSGISSERYHSPRKRYKVQHGGIAPEEIRIDRGRTYLPSSTADLETTPYPALHPPEHRIGESVGGQPSFHSGEFTPAYRHRLEQPSLRLVRRPVANGPPVHGVSINQGPGDIIGHEQRHTPLSPRFVSRSDGAGYMFRDDNPPIRSKQFLHSIVSQHDPLLLSPGKVEPPNAHIYGSDRSHPVLVRSNSPERREFASGPRPAARSEMYAHDFVRPVQWQGRETPPGYKPIAFPREVTATTGSGTGMQPSGLRRYEAEERRIPPSSRPVQPPPPNFHSSSVRDPIQDPYQAAHHPRLHNPESGGNSSAQHGYHPPEIDNSRGPLHHERYYPTDDFQRPPYQCSQGRMAPPDQRSTYEYHQRVRPRSEVFAAGH
ncbi:hypothetical protein VTO42DRAFT_5459 [Malbranchea cinnamomea]